MIRKTGKGRLLLGMAAGAALCAPTLAGTAQAQAGATSASQAGAMAAGLPYDASMSAPSMVNGRVNNYWTDESGYVTAVDVQTANGPAVIRFSPGMAMRTMQTYPVGSTADFWVRGSMENGMQKWDMVGMGQKQPSSWYRTTGPSGLGFLMSSPYVQGNAETMSVRGELEKVIVDNMGTVVGLVINTEWLGKGAIHRTISGKNEPREVTWMRDGGMGMNGMGMNGMGMNGMNTGAGMGNMGNMGGMGMTRTLIRVPAYTRDAPNMYDSMRRKTPLRVGDVVSATGFLEAPEYGTTSPYSMRFAANALSVNGRGVGAKGFASYMPEEKALFGFNLNIPLITGGSDTQLPVVPMGYEVYSPEMGSNMSMGNAMMSK